MLATLHDDHRITVLDRPYDEVTASWDPLGTHPMALRRMRHILEAERSGAGRLP